LAFKPTLPTLGAKTKKSSAEWLRRQSQDPFVKQRASILVAATSLSFRSRSAFKLLEIHEKYDGFLTKPDVRVVVDLGAAPGGWSQVARKVVDDVDDSEFDYTSSSPVKIIAVDRLAMDPIPGVHTLKADFLHPQTESLIGALIRGSNYKLTLSSGPPKADVILSDIAPNLTGHPAVDSEANFLIAQAVMHFTRQYLRTAEEIGRGRGGVLVLKHFAHPTMDTFRRDVLERYFRDVIYTKPKASRQESGEGYFLCRGY
ncbi:23S ribosomal RNA methyltransferase, partial [Gymnopus androsaceus JB14]